MGSVTVRKIDEDVIRDLRISAAKRGVSMEQEARDRLRRPLPEEDGKPGGEARGWRLKGTKQEILALGRRLPNMNFDQKTESDRLYDYLDEEK